MAGAAHLVKRFFGSILPIGPRAADRTWALAQLLPGEQAIWRQMSAADRRHAAGVARRVQSQLGDQATRPVLAAALLHDCGKTVAGLGTGGRVIATLLGTWAGHARGVEWRERRGFTRRVGLHLDHPRLGGELLGQAGSAPLTVAWATEHHLAPEDWTVPLSIGEALKAADDD